MPGNSLKWYTCTPVAFVGDESFFMRDSGLMSRSFRRLGIESKSVMPLPGNAADYTDELIRTEYAHLESPEWWKSLGIDGVLLYSWGAPRYRRIAQAVRKAGLKLAVFMDFSGDLIRWWRLPSYFRAKLASRPDAAPVSRWFAACRDWLHDAGTDLLRNRHLSAADVVILGNPFCRENFAALKWLYKPSIARHAQILPCPIHERFVYDAACPKEYRVIAIGRWDDEHQKRPAFLTACLEHLTARDEQIVVDIYGTITPQLQDWHGSLPSQVQARILLHGFLPNEELLGVYRRSMVSVCSSSYESAHIVSVEALCCGCSIAAPPRDGLLSLRWYASEDEGAAGTIATSDTPESLADAVLHELQLWKTGRRNPMSISRTWSERVHALSFLPRLLRAIDRDKP